LRKEEACAEDYNQQPNQRRRRQRIAKTEA
jgi:hypothetical protein